MSKTERQEREEKIWNEYIQPLINEYGLTHLKYKCMDWDPKWMDGNEKNFGTGAWSGERFEEDE